MKEWYLGDDWDDKTQQVFEEKLKRARGSYNKAQYLRIKGSSLLESRDSQKRIAGSELLKRVIHEYPNEISNVMFAYEQLGDCYFNEKKYSEAESNYRQSVSFYKENGRSGTSGIGDIKLAETIIWTKQFDKFLEMYHLLTDEFKKNNGSLTLNEDIFRYYSVLAKLSNALEKKDEAKEYAHRALQLSETKEPQFNNYPELGLIIANTEELNGLQEILNC